MFSIGDTNENLIFFEPADDLILKDTPRDENGSCSRGVEPNESLNDTVEDCAYGEPLVQQHILIDFTPDRQIDNEYVQKKCCDFWDFIKSVPEIQNLMVYPENQQPTKKSNYSTIASKNDEKSEKADDTAINILDFIHEKGITPAIFGSKLAKSKCSLGSREYKELEEPTKKQKKIKKTGLCSKLCRDDVGLQCPFPCEDCCQPKKYAQLKTMVKTMQDWDEKHPKWNGGSESNNFLLDLENAKSYFNQLQKRRRF